MEQTYIHTKEAIRQRMFNHAASFWGVRSIDELDPVVLRLIEGLASEIYNVNNTVQDINLRILESLATVLTPSVLVSPRPAHSVMQVTPADPYLYLDKHTLFNDKKISQEMHRHGIENLSFVPVTNVKLVSGKIKHMVCERMFFRSEEGGEKTLLAHAHTLNEKINHTVWVGMDFHKEIESLKDISFFIEFPHSDNKYEKYSLLSYSKWKMGDQVLEMSSGLPLWEDEETKLSVENGSIFSRYDLLNETDNSILDLYRMQFLTVNNPVSISDTTKAVFPEEIKSMFPETVMSGLEPCHWIKITFPPHISPSNLQDIVINLNAFPIANKALYSKIYASNDMTGILPLRTQNGESFLSIEKVVDSHGYEYHSIPYTSEMNTETGVYSIKKGGVERFEIRDAKEYIERLIDLLQSEVSAFTSMDMDNIRNIIINLKKGLVDMNSKFSNSKLDNLESPRYLLLNTINPKDSVFVDYWATHCERANGIRAGKVLTPLASLPIAKDSSKLLKITSGGKSAPNVTGRLDAFRYAITSRDQINTHNDAVNFCLLELGEKINRVEVKPGVMVSPKPKEGLVRTIDVHLTPTPGYSTIVEEMRTELLIRLHQKSPDWYNYRVILKTTP